MTTTSYRHPKGTKARILLTSVFGPYAHDDSYGSRLINPMELYHNQVTKVQGAFSPRRFHHSWGIMMIQENISAPSTVLDFPSRESFARELESGEYDIIGISSIIVNVGKVQEMCRIIRETSPGVTIVVGGHIAAIPDIENMIDADHIVKGDGIAWMREYLGEDKNTPLKHPYLPSGFNLRAMGINVPEKLSESATIIASVGCPMGCNFCTTSAFFGGKGTNLQYLPTGQDLFQTMEKAEKKKNIKSFSIIDENFLLQKERAMELLQLMKENNKSWSLHVFSSANAIEMYTFEELVELGISSIWIGLESPQASYAKLNGTDTRQLAYELQKRGILLLGSSIIGLEHHTPENIQEEIDYAISHDVDFHQFMLYTPVPGTPLYKDMKEQEKLLDVELADIHGQFAFNFEHDYISKEQSCEFLDRAFRRDFDENGPSLFRMCRTALKGWQQYKNHPDLRVRKRFVSKKPLLKYGYAPILWAMEKLLLNKNPQIATNINNLRKELEQEFGLMTTLSARLLGPIIRWAAAREEKRLEQGKTYEPKTFITRQTLRKKLKNFTFYPQYSPLLFWRRWGKNWNKA